MTLCCNNALGELELCSGVGVNKLASASACDVTALTNGSYNADGTSVSERNLNLACRTSGAEDGCLDRALGAYNNELLVARVLTGLAEILLLGELIACTKEDVNCLTAKVDVSCRSFNNNLLHYKSLLID